MHNNNNTNICYSNITKMNNYDNEANTITVYMKMICDVCATTTTTICGTLL